MRCRTTTWAPNTSCSGCSTRAGTFALRVLAALESTWTTSAPSSAGSMPRADGRHLKGHIPFTPRVKTPPRAHGQKKPCRSATTTSAASTCSSGSWPSRMRRQPGPASHGPRAPGPPAWPSPERSSSLFTKGLRRPSRLHPPSTDDVLAQGDPRTSGGDRATAGRLTAGDAARGRTTSGRPSPAGSSTCTTARCAAGSAPT